MSSQTEAATTRKRTREAPARADESVRALLSSLISQRLVPELVTANRTIEPTTSSIAPTLAWSSGFDARRPAHDAQIAATVIRAADVLRFVRLLRGGSADAALAFVEILQARGVSRQTVYLDLLAPAARMIGAMWCDDECSFADVTMVVGRLHQIVKSFHDQQPARLNTDDAPRILLAPSPGEQHVFALDLVEAFFRDGGWHAELAHTDVADEVIARVANEPFDAVGFTLSRGDAADLLRAMILQLRAHSLRRDLLVLVGGPAFDADPGLAGRIGADTLPEAGVIGAIKARNMLPPKG